MIEARCPRCGEGGKVAVAIPDVGSQFECATIALLSGGYAEGLPCILRQRDQLEEKVERLEAWKAEVIAVEAKWDAQAIAAMLGSRLGESTRTAIQREVPLLLERVKRLAEAGQDAIDYIDGKHRDAGRVLDGWRKASV